MGLSKLWTIQHQLILEKGSASLNVLHFDQFRISIEDSSLVKTTDFTSCFELYIYILLQNKCFYCIFGQVAFLYCFCIFLFYNFYCLFSFCLNSSIFGWTQEDREGKDKWMERRGRIEWVLSNLGLTDREEIDR